MCLGPQQEKVWSNAQICNFVRDQNALGIKATPIAGVERITPKKRSRSIATYARKAIHSLKSAARRSAEKLDAVFEDTRTDISQIHFKDPVLFPPSGISRSGSPPPLLKADKSLNSSCLIPGSIGNTSSSKSELEQLADVFVADRNISRALSLMRANKSDLDVQVDGVKCVRTFLQQSINGSNHGDRISFLYTLGCVDTMMDAVSNFPSCRLLQSAVFCALSDLAKIPCDSEAEGEITEKKPDEFLAVAAYDLNTVGTRHKVVKAVHNILSKHPTCVQVWLLSGKVLWHLENSAFRNGWMFEWHFSSNRPYYYHTASGKTSWKAPCNCSSLPHGWCLPVGHNEEKENLSHFSFPLQQGYAWSEHT